MPGGAGAGGSGGAPTATQADAFPQYVNDVAKATGLDPRVIYAWAAGEGHPGDESGFFNWMNIQTPTAQSLNVAVQGTGPANTAIFGNLQAGEVAAEREIHSLGIDKAAGQSPQDEIAAIAASPWASSHYGGPGGPNLVNDFIGLYGQSALGTYRGAGVSASGPATTGTVGGTLDEIPGVSSISGAVSGLDDGIKFLFSYRFLEIIGGGLLVLIGVVGLMREAGIKTPELPGPLGATNRAISGGFDQGQRQGQVAQARQAGRQSAASGGIRDTETPRSKRATSIRQQSAAMTDEVPF